jgi:hypothetical protein
MRFRGMYVKGFNVGLDNGQGVLGAFSEAGAEAVAVLLGHEPGLSVGNPDGALGAGGDAEAATVAFFFIDPDDFSFHFFLLFSIVCDPNIMQVPEICFDLSQGSV